MLGTIRTLILGANAAAEEHVRDLHAIPLIDQKIRETEANLRAAKITLASLIQRHRSEQKLAAALDGKIADLTARAQEALAEDREDLAQDAAQAIAQMENEQAMRQTTIERLDQKITRLRSTVESAQRRVIDLRQGAIAARAVRNEQKVQGRFLRTFSGRSSADEAEELINKVVGSDDGFEQSEILREIETELTHDGLADRMAAEGFGPATKSTAADVLNRLKKSK
ncbi:phage shock protein A, PspA [Candidatus Rhodobacter oscarellae]|uniref:Phage shock protein A, PspA n=1 Tax=Candidatus Rhodobacter oscarellae TaxID=1675527 RepID=A0A0J9E2V3_9RHOB|nr:PspA/IM30 family protein [Candidatus Rhodobacter lobularis]KMW57060.1 phage shock protein A, PspA [Candidatus Rhodobacter lobularis]